MDQCQKKDNRVRCCQISVTKKIFVRFSRLGSWWTWVLAKTGDIRKKYVWRTCVVAFKGFCRSDSEEQKVGRSICRWSVNKGVTRVRREGTGWK